MKLENREIALEFLRKMQSPPPGILSADFTLIVTGRGPRDCTRNASEIAALQKATADAAAGEFTITPLKQIFPP